ncbi:unnamed protein product [Hymenolepis diminuta]|uniref:Peptidase_M13 domain-containing protein n=1 Tax=Hymenolepis diminuta TaxID=6216 RepID=A0A0R3SZ92_HYMDI|nr:unnamed protein product [Hymenolepis diminuta]
MSDLTYSIYSIDVVPLDLNVITPLFCDTAKSTERSFQLVLWDMAPHIVNAYYNPRENHIYFPAGILQKPFYDANFPLALNYGGIGVVVGHEIAHKMPVFLLNFYLSGSKFDAMGNLRQWWSESTRVDFEKNSECLVRQYGNYTVLGKNVG